MGFFGRIFGKKKEEPGLDQELKLDSSLPSDDLNLDEKPVLPEEPTPLEQPSALEHPADVTHPSLQPQQPAAPLSARDIELLNSKLDTLKAILNSTDQRLANLEKAAGVEQKKKMPW